VVELYRRISFDIFSDNRTDTAADDLFPEAASKIRHNIKALFNCLIEKQISNVFKKSRQLKACLQMRSERLVRLLMNRIEFHNGSPGARCLNCKESGNDCSGSWPGLLAHGHYSGKRVRRPK